MFNRYSVVSGMSVDCAGSAHKQDGSQNQDDDEIPGK